MSQASCVAAVSAVHAPSLPADPLQAVGREKAMHRYFEEVDAKHDAKRSLADMRLVPVFDVRIAVLGTEYPDLLKSVAADRLAAYDQVNAPVTEALVKRGVRNVSVGNGLYPTAAAAKELGVSLDTLTKESDAED